MLKVEEKKLQGYKVEFGSDGVSREVLFRIERGDKVLEILDVDEANAVEHKFAYYVDRLSESKGKYILFRRERGRS